MIGQMRSTLVVCALAGCSFNPGAGQGSGSDADAGVDAPPPLPQVRFTAITSAVSELRPGLYGFEITAVLENGLDAEITEVAVSLEIGDGRSGDFSWRSPDAREGISAPPPASIAAGASQTYVFVVDALASAAPPGPIAINGTATFDAGGTAASATPAAEPLELPFAAALNAAIVVSEPSDESDADDELSLREAIALANATAGPDRIVFDPASVDAGDELDVDDGLGPLPPITGDLVIDGSGVGPVLTFDSDWDGDNVYGLQLDSGTAVISGLGFRDMGFAYEPEDVSANNCGPLNMQFEGGAIRVNGGTLILDGNSFEDPNVPERNCYAASVRLEGGSGHRVLRNHWTAPSMDALYVGTAVVEITGNVIDSVPDANKSDECIYIAGQGGQDMWITGNLCVDQEFSAVVAEGADPGVLRIAHNTFVRTGITDLAAVRRNGGARDVVLRNNAYVNNRASVVPDNNGVDLDIAFEASSNAVLCGACGGATVDAATMITGSDLMLVNSAGTDAADLSPALGSPLLNSAAPLLDRNGKSPGWFGGAGPERGAVER